MDRQKQEHIAVLTGDLVNSTSLTGAELDTVREQFLANIANIKSWKPGLVKSGAEFFRGDAWQLAISDPSMALRVAFFLRAKLLSEHQRSGRKHLDTRISVGIGKVERLSKKRISLSSGEAFLQSGRGLDSLKGKRRLTIAFPKPESCENVWIELCTAFSDDIIGRWSQRQAEIVSIAIVPGKRTHDEIAASLSPPVSKQMVSKTLIAADWDLLEKYLSHFES